MNGPTLAIMAECRRLGVALRVNAGGLQYRPAAGVSPDLAARLHANAAEVVNALMILNSGSAAVVHGVAPRFASGCDMGRFPDRIGLEVGPDRPGGNGDGLDAVERAAIHEYDGGLDRADADRLALAGVTDTSGDGRILIGDFRKLADAVPDASVNLIFTDPPYDREAEKMFPALAAFAARKLAAGGSLLSYVGHVQLPAALDAFRRCLTYWWTCACVHRDGCAYMRKYDLDAAWKPILWLTKGTGAYQAGRIRDVVSGGRDKRWHPWGQSEPEAAYWIENLCPPGGLVVDPFLGGGTTAAAARRLGRRWIGIELDPQTAAKARQRLNNST